MEISKLKSDHDLCGTCNMNSTLVSVVPLAMFVTLAMIEKFQSPRLGRVELMPETKIRTQPLVPKVSKVLLESRR